MNQELLKEDKFRSIAKWIIFSGAGLFSAFSIFFLIYDSVQEKSWNIEIVKSHYAATVGIYLDAVAATCIVFLFEFVSGPIKFEIPGFKFEGASGPVILWICCFLSIVVAMKILW